MPAVTDLTWGQLRNGFGQVFGVNITGTTYTENPDGSGTITFSLSQIASVKAYFNNPSSGVIKVLSGLIASGRVGQETANQGQATGERLAAFPAPTTGAPANGQVPVTYSIAAKALLSSATQFIGNTV